jgi:hypothetical protein
MKPLRFHSLAEAEVFDAESQSSNLYLFGQELNRRLEEIQYGQVRHAKIYKEACQCVMSRLPYSIIYTEEPSEIFIVAFAHHKRKPGYWKRRLKP